MADRPAACWVAEVEKAKQLAVFRKAYKITHHGLVDESWGGPEAADAIGGCGQVQILDGASHRLDFFEFLDAPVRVRDHAYGDEGGDRLTSALERVKFLLRKFVSGEGFVPLRQLGADFFHALTDINREPPRLRHSMGRCPSGVTQHELDLFLVDLTRGELFGQYAASIAYERCDVAEVVSHGLELMLRIYGVEGGSW